MYRRKVKAQQLWFAVIESQIETGTPYILYKDACNRKSNQQNLGTIKCSNLCTEIVEYSSPEEVTYIVVKQILASIKCKFGLVIRQVAVCNLASIALNMFVKPDKTFDFPKLRDVTKVITRNLNKIIEINYYPVPEVRFIILFNDEFSYFKSLFFRPNFPTFVTVRLELEFKAWLMLLF